MIFRTNTRINVNADEISFKLSYSHIDVKRWLKAYALIMIKARFEEISDDEASLRYWLEHEFFKNFPSKYAEQMSRWAVTVAIRKKFLLPSAASPTKLIFSDAILKKLYEEAQESD